MHFPLRFVETKVKKNSGSSPCQLWQVRTTNSGPSNLELSRRIFFLSFQSKTVLSFHSKQEGGMARAL